jgi:hypothetical protein
MTLHSLETLTWGTVTGAVVSALLLASGEAAWPELSRWQRDLSGLTAGDPPAAAPRKETPAPGDAARRPDAATQPTPR